MLNELKFYFQNQEKIKKAIFYTNQEICNLLDCKIKFGAELEFYFNDCAESLQKEIENNVFLNKIIFPKLEQEKGLNQFELKFLVQESAVMIAENISKCREILKKYAKENIKFNAKPYNDQPGSSMHIHISLHRGTKNLFEKNGEDESLIMKWSLAGLCEVMRISSMLFVGDASDFQRLKSFYNSPINVSWGGNNRTVALRLPCTGEKRRIEHRLASSAADPYLVIFSILKGIKHGLINKLQLKIPKIYGIAYDEQYKLDPLPNNIFAAIKLLNNVDNKNILGQFCCE